MKVEDIEINVRLNFLEMWDGLSIIEKYSIMERELNKITPNGERTEFIKKLRKILKED